MQSGERVLSCTAARVWCKWSGCWFGTSFAVLPRLLVTATAAAACYYCRRRRRRRFLLSRTCKPSASDL